MLVAVVIHKDKDSDYGVTVPDFPGCFSAGDTLEDTLSQAQEAIELHIEGMLEDGEAIPGASALDALQRKREFKGGTWYLVKIDPSRLSGKAKRINVTIPENLLVQIDEAAKFGHLTRSAFLAQAAMEKISAAA